MKKKIVIIGLVIIVVLGGLIYFVRNNDDIETAMAIKNETNEMFEAVGILLDSKVILNKTNGESFSIPKTLTTGINEASIIAIKSDGKILKSQAISLDNKKINIKGIEGESIKLNIEGMGKTYKEFEIPQLNEWKIESEGNIISASFKANTDINYTLYVLGKGGNLGISDTLSNNAKVIASWEKPKTKIDSWIVFTK